MQKNNQALFRERWGIGLVVLKPGMPVLVGTEGFNGGTAKLVGLLGLKTKISPPRARCQKNVRELVNVKPGRSGSVLVGLGTEDVKLWPELVIDVV